MIDFWISTSLLVAMRYHQSPLLFLWLQLSQVILSLMWLGERDACTRSVIPALPLIPGLCECVWHLLTRWSFFMQPHYHASFLPHPGSYDLQSNSHLSMSVIDAVLWLCAHLTDRSFHVSWCGAAFHKCASHSWTNRMSDNWKILLQAILCSFLFGIWSSRTRIGSYFSRA
jgi:hypothetical protein